MDNEEVLQRLLAAQDGTELTPTAEMMMMNSATMNDLDSFDAELVSALQQQTTRINNKPSIVTSTVSNIQEVDDDDDLVVEDETILERIAALKEMFPERIQNAVGSFNNTIINTSKLAFNKGRTAAWWITSTMCVLVFPILIQKELLQVAEQISREQRSILLGPQAATGAFSSGGGGGAF